ncbi:MAG: hypothetical protein QOK37_1995 [Thermoanaerobaculia bacterium]|jgi:hypothetical protein|nr:hypothetical protein [Thermoanaerobaculia bacterium]
MVMWLVTGVFVVLAVLAFRGQRWAYFTFVILGVLYFPASVAFHFHPRPCDCALSWPLILFALTKYGHIVRFAIFFPMTSVQMRGYSSRAQILVSWGAVMAMGIYVELAEGFTGSGNCRLRDLFPDAAGAMIGTVLWLAWSRFWRSRA